MTNAQKSELKAKLRTLEVGDTWRFGTDFVGSTVRKYARVVGIEVMIFSGLNSCKRIK